MQPKNYLHGSVYVNIKRVRHKFLDSGIVIEGQIPTEIHWKLWNERNRNLKKDSNTVQLHHY